ncbi:unnamed protein product [Penicillium salamii]|uniref:penicillopepsin n=1 Tax=Penicillium salamii TaxID=1612424 RepID=A0A9W4JW46_9EURO|nr:unnamed protein product [Penicillium salamii]CAG7976354.1 unnamed protein product [Penicillium salamii]CAG7999459.1 unnamed protein product [Penicillium salamii]CAG8194421.1 unnamed protein product [Penicillium salamii]CAG8257054.1 unnamed protein product [Penicillium salamii]
MRVSQSLVGVPMAFAWIASASTTIPLISAEYGTVFDAPMTIGNQSFQMLVDTGSSDTYVMQDGYTCINGTGTLAVPREDCKYAKSYHPSNTLRRISGQNFGIEYGAGIASGYLAYEEVSLGNITVKKQKVGIADRSNPMGDGVNSGLLGLAYPSITSAHPGNSTDNTTYWYNRLPYDPLINTMHKEGKIEPNFSLALARSPQNQSTSFGGYLTLGGLPPVKYDPEFAVTPVEFTDIPLNFTSGKRVLSYWTTTIDEVTFGPSSNNLTTNSTKFKAFIDSGNYVTYLPSAVVEPINALFSPPATYNEDLKAYVVDCSSKAPQFGLKLGNQTFFHNGSDLIFRVDGICVSSLFPSEKVSLGDVTVNILGVPFLKNVLTVFDFGNDEMRFAKLLEVKENGTRLPGNETQSPEFSIAARGSSIPSWGYAAFTFILSFSWALGLS